MFRLAAMLVVINQNTPITVKQQVTNMHRKWITYYLTYTTSY